MDNFKLPLVKCSLVLSSKLHNLSELETAFLVDATFKRKAEDFPVQSKKAGLAENYCTFSVQQANCLSIERIVHSLFANYIDKKEVEICKLSRNGWTVSFVIIIHMLCGEGPEMVLSADVVKKISNMNGSLNIDLYDYSKEEMVDYIPF